MVPRIASWTFAAAALLSPTTSWSQTAEETVIFMLYGDQDNKRTGYLGEEIEKITKINNCKYRILLDKTDVDPIEKLELTVDFSGVSEVIAKDYSYLNRDINPRFLPVLGIKFIGIKGPC